MKVHYFEQGTPEWFAVRKGKMTASNAQAIGNYGKGLDTYIHEMMAEFYSSGEKEHFSSKHTDRGNEYEPIARAMYELERGVTVEQVGFIEFDEFSGASPDGLVDLDGMVEIKSLDDVKYFKHILNGEKEIDSGHVWQIQMGLLFSGRKWCDLLVYNPNFNQSMCIYRIYPDAEKFAELEKGLAKGREMITNIKNKIQ
jgi:putative phage-type endonuclease